MDPNAGVISPDDNISAEIDVPEIITTTDNVCVDAEPKPKNSETSEQICQKSVSSTNTDNVAEMRDLSDKHSCDLVGNTVVNINNQQKTDNIEKENSLSISKESVFSQDSSNEPVVQVSTSTSLPRISQQSVFIGPVIPKGLVQNTDTYSESEFLTADRTSENISELARDRVTCKNTGLNVSEPVNKKMRYETGHETSQDLDEMCQQVLDDSGFDLSNKEQSDTLQEERNQSEPCRSKSIKDMDVIHNPVFVTWSSSEFQTPANDNYLRGCKWSPDGTCLLTNSNDNKLRLFDLPAQLYEEKLQDIPEMTSVLQIKECDTIYDYCWYPQMTSKDPETSCLGFSCNGQKLYCGANKMIRIFDIDRPGKHFGQSGIISCIIPNPGDTRIIAAGSFNRSIALYNHEAKNMLCMFEGQQGGVTHMVFSPDGTKLFSGGRKDPEIICWDLRNPGQILFVALRQVETNQRMYFELDSLNPVHPVIATSSGQRHFPELADSDDSDNDVTCHKQNIENSIKLWWLT
ncbi:hypothetical protein KUTeg_012735 [Tegillarca granosa]|uniref:WD repeat-containing protein 79 n=1 Tax=Tegillarca granosa TaxID=220873 RepID=A0ABQ9F3X3_TEGGR|nr:hypothetical protein KUTeg_012735 [Tegillarca granosa]